MNEHTKGPWLLDDGLPGGVYSDDATGSIVARCMGIGFEWVSRPRAESIANAQLISAAPDMLAALRNVQKLISEAAMTGFNWKDGDWADRLFFSQQVTSEAIRKATAQTAGERS